MTHFIDFNDFHSDVLRTTPTDVRADPPRLLALSALGLGGETGEVIDVVKKLLFHRTRPDGPIPSEIREQLIGELGDVLFYLALGAEALGVTLAHVANRNIAKRRARYPSGFDVAAAEKRLRAKAKKRPTARRPPRRRGKTPPAY